VEKPRLSEIAATLRSLSSSSWLARCSRLGGRGGVRRIAPQRVDGRAQPLEQVGVALQWLALQRRGSGGGVQQRRRQRCGDRVVALDPSNQSCAPGASAKSCWRMEGMKAMQPGASV